MATALRELENAGFLVKEVVKEKPLHIEYTLTEKGRSTIPVLTALEQLK